MPIALANYITRLDESILVPGYTWQCAWPVPSDDGEETFWRVGFSDEPYGQDYFDELDTLDEAIEFITRDGQSDADIEAAI